MHMKPLAERLNIEAEHKKLLDSATLSLAAIAWAHYLLEGRGAIYIDLGLCEALDSENCTLQARYLLPESELLGDDECEAIASYDPTREIVISLNLPNKEMPVYICGTIIPPEQAYALLLMQATSSVPLSLNN